VSFVSSPSPSVRRIVPVPYFGWRTRVPMIHFPPDFLPAGACLEPPADSFQRRPAHDPPHRPNCTSFPNTGTAGRRRLSFASSPGPAEPPTGIATAPTLLIRRSEKPSEARRTQEQLSLSSRHSDIKQSPLFFELIGISEDRLCGNNPSSSP
jgi:hypothetical protein